MTIKILQMAALPLLLVTGLVASPAFALPTTVSGKTVVDAVNSTVEVGEHKGMVVVFLSAACPCSNSHLGELKSLQKDFPEFSFLAIHSNTDEAKEETVVYFKKANLPFPVLQDTGAKLANEFKAFKTPHAFVILKDGSIAYQGGVTDSHDFGDAKQKYLREALGEIKDGHKVALSNARTLGCAISRQGKYVW